MVDSALSNTKTTKELEQELRTLLMQKKETSMELKRIIRENRIFE